ncbi:hypothetical protein D3C73_1450170 [compost metagenome]
MPAINRTAAFFFTMSHDIFCFLDIKMISKNAAPIRLKNNAILLEDMSMYFANTPTAPKIIIDSIKYSFSFILLFLLSTNKY